MTQKEERQKLLAESYEWIKSGNGTVEVKNIGKEQGIGRFANYVEETAGKEETANMYEYEKIEEETGKSIKFQWLTNIELTKGNLEKMIEAGRGRWNIENERFNNQKNEIYDMEHLNSKDRNAMKNHYLLTQISDIIMQLYLAWNPVIKKMGQSIKNTSSRLLESFRGRTVTSEDIEYIQAYTTIYLE